MDNGKQYSGMFRKSWRDLKASLRGTKTLNDVYVMSEVTFADAIDRYNSPRMERVINAIKSREERDINFLSRRLDRMKVGSIVYISDLSNYQADRSSDGGCYSFHIIYRKCEDRSWIVKYATSSSFRYCQYYGNFCNDDCDEKCPDRYFESISSKAVAFAILDKGDDEEVDYR